MPDAITKYLSSWIFVLICAVVFSVFSVVTFGSSSYDLDGFRLGFGVAPSLQGETELVIPPFGEVTALTHKTPLKIKVTLERIYLREFTQAADRFNGGAELMQGIEIQAKKAFREFIFRLIALAAIGGAIGALIPPRRSLVRVLSGTIIGAILVGMVLIGTQYTFNSYAFKQPRYSGALSVAPWATEAIAKRLADIKTFKKEIREIVGNIDRFYSKINSWQPIKEDTVKLLHVSDVHNNPVAVDLIKRVVKDFDVDVIIDTGDITDFGTPVETNLIEGIAALPAPYVYVAGNHDSSETVAYMKDIENVTVLEGAPVEVKGITFLGFPDPSSTTFNVKPADGEELSRLNYKIKNTLDFLPQKPLILAVHNPKAAEGLFGEVPIVLVGHTHKARLEEKDGFVLNNAGTTGAAGVRTFQVQDGVPYTLNLFHIDKSTNKLVAVDSLAVIGLSREFKLERKLIEGNIVSKEGNALPEAELEMLNTEER